MADRPNGPPAPSNGETRAGNPSCPGYTVYRRRPLGLYAANRTGRSSTAVLTTAFLAPRPQASALRSTGTPGPMVVETVARLR